MDWYVLGDVEKDTNRHVTTTEAQLIDRIKAIFKTLAKGKGKISLLQVSGPNWGYNGPQMVVILSKTLWE